MAAHQTVVARHMRLHACHQLAWAEGFGQIIVRAQSQTANLVDIVLLGGNHQNGHVLVLADALADLKPVNPRKHQVQDNQIKLLCQRSCKTCVSAVLNLDLKVIELQIILLKLSDCLLILHN